MHDRNTFPVAINSLVGTPCRARRPTATDELPLTSKALEALLCKAVTSAVSHQLEAILNGVRRVEAKECPSAPAGVALYRLPEVLEQLRISKSTLYSWLNPNSPHYVESLPRPFKLGDHACSPIAWRAADIDSWISARCRAESRDLPCEHTDAKDDVLTDRKH